MSDQLSKWGKKDNLTLSRFAVGASLLLASGLLIYAAWMVWRILYDPNVIFIFPKDGAHWIRYSTPFSAGAHQDQQPGTYLFRKEFVLADTPPSDVILYVAATGAFDLFYDGKKISVSQETDNWKTERKFLLGSPRPHSTHELLVKTTNPTGPALIRVRSNVRDLCSDASWQTSCDGEKWVSAVRAAASWDVEMARSFRRADKDFLSNLPLTIAVTIIAALILLAAKAFPKVSFFHRWRSTHFRWVCLGLWTILSLNNLVRLPPNHGFDLPYHFDYIWFIAFKMKLPLASDGAQMFQPPLYYLLSAPLLRLFWIPGKPETAIVALRLLPLFAGALQIEICFRIATKLFPEREDLQAICTAFSTFLPMNLYISQYLSNQPFEGVLSAFVLYLAFRMIHYPHTSLSFRQKVMLGCVWGLALLSKANALVLAIPLLFAITYTTMKDRDLKLGILRQFSAHSATVFGCAFLVAGWYYLRNWIIFGKPILGGWDALDGTAWWQDPGYRTLTQLIPRGNALFYPIFASASNFWDGVYSTFWADGLLSGTANIATRPPWNYGFMNTSLWLALVPSIALLVGIVSIRKQEAGKQFALLFFCLAGAIYFAALLHHFLTLPYYCAVKSFYMVGAIPSFAVLTTAGFERIRQNFVASVLVTSLFVAWAFYSYLTYWAMG
ncbi:MAG TPA: hypothetical protein PKY35_11225 [Candidatus Hydrogenedentes bacterium]|nr:hypothetical protein [Candidatus Hydrogenedentota bacterium]HOL77589.1 hypothetical protein [Candidatus Hydrogenedentota bacterium]HPO86714.1 hypothetical protein [Candidatus Hydrogenedentota bacterium]